MSLLKEQIEELNKKFYIAQEKLKTAEETISQVRVELKDKFKIDPKIIEDPKMLQKLIDKTNNSIEVAEEKLLATARSLNDRISVT